MLFYPRKYVLIVFFFLYLPVFSVQPDDSIRSFITGKIHYGFVLPHHSFIEYLVNSHLYAVELNYTKVTPDSNYYKPEKGLGLIYSQLGNNELLGTSVSLLGFYNYNILHSSDDWFRTDFRIGLGLGYVTKTFDLYSNNTDLAISAHINAHINLGLEFKYRVSSSCAINFGGRLMHLSNGKMSAPNYGINLMTINAGISCLVRDRTTPYKKLILPVPKTWIYEAVVAGGVTVIAAHMPGLYPVASAQVNGYRQFNQKGRLGVGVDFFYNQSTYPSLITHNLYDWLEPMNFKKSDNMSAGIHLAYEICHNRLTYTIQLGSYLKSAVYGTGGLYHRIGLKYTLTEHLMLNLSLKTHWAVAEYVEWGIGYRITRQ